MDLTKQPPRRPSNLRVGGIVGLARMTDKARAHEGELLGEYKYGVDSGLDRDVLEFVHMEAGEFAEQAVKLDDTSLGKLAVERASRSTHEIDEFNTFRLEQTPHDELHERLLVERIAKYAPGSADINTVFQSIELDDWGAFRDKDLTIVPPRTPYLRTVANIVGAARMADKARAFKVGKVGAYKYGSESPLDQRILECIGMSQADFAEGAYANPNDDELSEWVTERSAVSPGVVSVLNAELCDQGLRTPAMAERFALRRDEVCPARLHVETWFDLMDIDDQQSFGIVDLTRQPPRSPYDTSMAGIMGLSRMLDKARAFNSGYLGAYYFGEDSGFDRWVMELVELTQEEVVAAVREHMSDDAVVEWLGDRLQKPQVDIAAHNQRLFEYGPANDRQEQFMRRAVSCLDPSRTDINTFAALSILDDAVSFARMHAGT